MTRRSLFLTVSGAAVLDRARPHGATAQALMRQPAEERAGAVRIGIETGNGFIAAILDDTSTARDFAALLPLRLTLRDYNATERIGDLPRRLSQQGAPPGITPVAGDITYYAPWGNLAIFYQDFQHSAGLIRLGRVAGNSDMALLRTLTVVRIARLQD